MLGRTYVLSGHNGYWASPNPTRQEIAKCVPRPYPHRWHWRSIFRWPTCDWTYQIPATTTIRHDEHERIVGTGIVGVTTTWKQNQ